MRRLRLLLLWGIVGFQHFLVFVGAPWGLVCMGDASSAGVFPHFHRAWVTEVCLSLDTPFGAEVGGSILHVTLGEFPGSHKQVLICFNGGVVIPIKSC